MEFTIKSVEVTRITGSRKVVRSTEQSNGDSQRCPDVVRHDRFLTRQRTSTVALQVESRYKMLDCFSASNTIALINGNKPTSNMRRVRQCSSYEISVHQTTIYVSG